MRSNAIAALLAALTAAVGCAHSGAGTAVGGPVERIDPELAVYIDRLRAVDDHTHVNSVGPGDPDFDALPLDPLLPFDLPARLRVTNPEWVAAYHTIYGDPAVPGERDLAELIKGAQSAIEQRGADYPAWVLDRIGTEVMLANRIAMGPGLAPPRFRWVAYDDALLFPLSTKAEASVTADRQKLYPYEEKLLKRYLSDLHVASLPATLDGYLKTVVSPTLERQHDGGCVAVKFEAAYLRSLDFAEAEQADASRVYARYVHGGIPSHAEYKTLEDFLFRAIARDAGRLGMAVHLHSFQGYGPYYRPSESDPLLLESAVNDPALRRTNFVILHGGGAAWAHAGVLLWKPNVYVDMSAMVLIYPPAQLADVLRGWLAQFPEKVLFGTDAAAYGPGIGWDVAAALGTTTARRALAIALSDMMRDGALDRERAERIAAMVMRNNAARIYHLKLS
jgi:predicted TIM-barrel fold metal-dependent hydrolase